MGTPLPPQLRNDGNKQVLNYLEGLSCHSDIVIPITQILKQYKQVRSYSPDGFNFGYCCWYRNDKIFAFAIGMSSVGIWAPGLTVDFPAVRTEDELGPDWHLIDWQSPHLAKLVDAGYNATLSL